LRGGTVPECTYADIYRVERGEVTMITKDFSIFGTMSTRVLQEILYQDSILPEGEGFDPDAVLYVMQVLAQREEGCPPVEDAWRRFNECYRHKE